MNSTKRLLFFLLVVLGIAGIAATVYFLFIKKDVLINGPSAPAPVVTALPAPQVVPQTTVADPAPQQVVPPSPDSEAELERKAREALFRRARDITSRIGSYGNADNYASIKDTYGDVTSDVQLYLEQERAKLQAAHPARGTSFAQTTRALAARLTVDAVVRTATEVDVVVDVQQRIEDGTTDATTVKQALLHLIKSGTEWNVSRIVWQDMGA